VQLHVLSADSGSDCIASTIVGADAIPIRRPIHLSTDLGIAHTKPHGPPVYHPYSQPDQTSHGPPDNTDSDDRRAIVATANQPPDLHTNWLPDR